MTETYLPQPDGIPVIYKDPSASLDYSEDWSAWLASGETITSYEVTVQSGLTQGPDVSTPIDAPTMITVELSGGEVGIAYLVSMAVVTSATPERRDTRSFRVHVLPR